MNFPTDLRYTENDEWIRMEGEFAVAGITDYAQDQLSDIVYVEITAGVGDTLARGESCAAVESVKAASDVYLPAGGTITEINEVLPATPELVNSDPYGAAWMVRLKLSDPAELEGLMDAAAYERHCQERSH
ncbi:MAG: glycine cleavage system protein H [Chloroflexi bacterium RBG_19FT_COMBO_62_14]|nr:MAG: glycine cleavage system protein H [Chloroflexi bacterium RBG_19FT_COMBO_62_14]